MRRSFSHRSAGILAAGGLLLAACGGGSPTADPVAADAQPAAGGPAASDDPAAGEAAVSDEPVMSEGAATLAEENGSGVSGEASLRWDPDTRVLVVTIALDGLEEGARYAGLIAPGCEPHSGLIYQTGTGNGGSDGTATWTAEVADVDGIDLDGGWGVRVARPPTGEQACGEVGPT